MHSPIQIIENNIPHIAEMTDNNCHNEARLGVCQVLLSATDEGPLRASIDVLFANYKYIETMLAKCNGTDVLGLYEVWYATRKTLDQRLRDAISSAVTQIGGDERLGDKLWGAL